MGDAQVAGLQLLQAVGEGLGIHRSLLTAWAERPAHGAERHLGGEHLGDEDAAGELLLVLHSVTEVGAQAAVAGEDLEGEHPLGRIQSARPWES